MYEVLIDEVENIHFQYDVYDKGSKITRGLLSPPPHPPFLYESLLFVDFKLKPFQVV